MPDAPGRPRTTCRVCGAADLERVLDLGRTALANRFLRPDQASEPEPEAPLDAWFCARCGQLQLGFVVDPEVLYREYIYVSSTSDTIPKHFAAYADEVATRFAPARSLVVEVASNDGCLLRAFRDRDVRVLGIEPARNVAKIAEAAGVPTLPEFFSESVARRVRSEHGAAAAVIANNVLAHVDDLDDFGRALDALLAPDGVAIVEVPHLLHLVRRIEFDTIYHEHLSYFALGTLCSLFERSGFRVFDARAVAVHGGSIRVFARRAAHAPPPSTAVAELLAEEGRAKLGEAATYRELARRVARLRATLMELLAGMKARGMRLAAYGAPAKGNTLLQYCGIGRELIDFAVDRSPLKQGLLTPGTKIPVRAPAALLEERPDAVLLLAWNFADEVLAQQAEYRARGGRFVIPVPEPRVV